MTDKTQLSPAEIAERDEIARQEGIVANVETELHGILKGINTYRTKRAETAELFATSAQKLLTDGTNVNGYTGFALTCKRSGVKEMGIYVLAEVELMFEDGSKKTLTLKSKMKTWNQSEKEITPAEPVEAKKELVHA